MEANKKNIKTIVNGEIIIKVVENILDNEINTIQMEEDDSITTLKNDVIECYKNLSSKLDLEGQKLLLELESLMIQDKIVSEKKYFEKGLKAGLTNLNFLKDLGAQYIL